MAVIWNHTIRKSVGIVIIPKVGYRRTVVGFGVCPDTSDPKLVKISIRERRMWEVDVFTLSTRVWKTVYMGTPFKLCDLACLQVFVNRVIYFRAYDDMFLDDGVRSNFVISFDLKSEKFGEVCLPEILLHTPHLNVAKVNESLGLLEYYIEDEKYVCGVWTRKDGDNKSFTKIYTIKVEGKPVYHRVLGFRNTGEVVMELVDEEPRIELYEPLSRHTRGVEINGKRRTFHVRSYMVTLLLLDQSDSIIH